MNFDKLQKNLNIKFKDIDLLKKAFIHRSYLNEVKEEKLQSNERLEFLGDSVLSLAVSFYLFTHFPNFEEGNLTNLRASVVCTKTLSEVALILNLGSYLKLSKGEDKSGGRKNASILADTFEALIGAIYLDCGFQKTIKFIHSILADKIKSVAASKNYKDPKSLFQELVQEKIRLSPVYKVLEEKGPDHAKFFTVGVYIKDKLYGKGIGRSKQEAQEQAAKSALENNIIR